MQKSNDPKQLTFKAPSYTKDLPVPPMANVVKNQTFLKCTE